MSEKVEGTKKKGKAKEPLTVEEYEKRVTEIVQEVSNLANILTGNNKKKYVLPEGAPARTEYTNLTKSLEKTVTLYKKLGKKQKRKVVNKSTATNRGFKQERFANEDLVAFVNENGDLPKDLHLKPSNDAGGDAIWTIAQCTQMIIWYVEQKGLKDNAKRSEIKLDAPLLKLFDPHFAKLDKSKKQMFERDGSKYIVHQTLQVLIPQLFDREITIPESMLTPDVRKTMLDREKLLKERTEQNRTKRAEEQKAAKDLARQAPKK